MRAAMEDLRALRRARGRRVRGARARVREVRARSRRQGGPVRARVRHHRRRREPGGVGGQVRGPAAGDRGVPGGELRARAAGGGERDARAVDVAPERRRGGGGRRPGLDHQPRGQSGLQRKQEQNVSSSRDESASSSFYKKIVDLYSCSITDFWVIKLLRISFHGQFNFPIPTKTNFHGPYVSFSTYWR
jgi:hypothetical protein